MADDETGDASEAVADRLAAVHLSASSPDAPGDKCCASCGKTGDGLKRCTACQSVWYCGVQCQIDHRKAHKKECKRIKKELELWKPHPPTKECPVCLVPLPLEDTKATYWACCGQTVCNACEEENKRGQIMIHDTYKGKQPDEICCAFCRQPVPEKDSEFIKQFEQRVDKGDLQAMRNLAGMYRDGLHGLARDEAKYMELTYRAADLGCPKALGSLGNYSLLGDQGVIRDHEKARTCLEDAAKKGGINARFYLGGFEETNYQHDLAMKHYKLAARAGDKRAMKKIWKYYLPSEKLTKAELVETLEAHKEACDGMNSKERERYDAYQEALAGNDSTLIHIYQGYYIGGVSAKELKEALKAHQKGDVEEVFTILSKSRFV